MDTKKLRQKILDLAIRGKLVPQDPNDEPASVLLERICAEKEQLIKEGKIKRSKQKPSDKPHYENVPFEIPKSWEWCRLEEICHIAGRIGFRGYTKADLVRSGGAITLSPSNIIEGQMNYDNCTFITWEKYEESPEIQIQDGDILLVKTGSSYGKCALVQKLPLEATINPQFVTLKHVGCNNNYLTCVLQSAYARKNYENFVLGTAIPTFTQVDLGNMTIPLPPLSEQFRIVTEIERWYAIIDRIEANKSDLQKFIQQTKSKVLSSAISGKLVPQDPNDEPAIELLRRINKNFTPCDTSHYENLPSSWQVATLKDVAKTVSVREHQILQREIQQEGLFPVVSQSANYIEGYSNQSEKVYKHEMPVIVFGDHTRVVKYIDFDFIIGADGIKVITPLIDAKYLFYLVLYASEQIKDRGYGRHFGYLSKFSIPIAPLSEQTRIVAKIEEVFDEIDSITSVL